jgi:hypothetical protein
MWLVTCLAIAAAGLVWWIMSRVSSYRTLFGIPHLMEVGQGIAALKQAAIQDLIPSDGGGIRPPDDARILRTSAGLLLVYTVNVGTAGMYVHHASVSIPGQVTTHAVGETFLLLWAKLLGVEYERLALQASAATVYHAEFALDENEQSNFARQPVVAPTVEWLQAFQAECTNARQTLRLHRSIAAAL